MLFPFLHHLLFRAFYLLMVFNSVNAEINHTDMSQMFLYQCGCRHQLIDSSPTKAVFNGGNIHHLKPVRRIRQKSSYAALQMSLPLEKGNDFFFQKVQNYRLKRVSQFRWVLVFLTNVQKYVVWLCWHCAVSRIALSVTSTLWVIDLCMRAFMIMLACGSSSTQATVLCTLNRMGLSELIGIGLGC